MSAVHVPAAKKRPAGIQPAKARLRTCVGCTAEVDVAAVPLVRLVLVGDEVAVDARGGGFGRGAHVHARGACLDKAASKGLARSFKAKVAAVSLDEGRAPLSGRALATAVRTAMDRRIAGFLQSAAAASRALALGVEAASGAVERGEASLLVVARDAAASAALPVVGQAVAAGRAVAWGSTALLGQLAGGERRSEGLGVIAVLSDRLGSAIAEAVAMAESASTGGAAKDSRTPPLAFGRVDEVDDRPSGPTHAERGA